jgi:hypothetical protein
VTAPAHQDFPRAKSVPLSDGVAPARSSMIASGLLERERQRQEDEHVSAERCRSAHRSHDLVLSQR